MPPRPTHAVGMILLYERPCREHLRPARTHTIAQRWLPIEPRREVARRRRRGSCAMCRPGAYELSAYPGLLYE